jgi:hypothetical protein
VVTCRHLPPATHSSRCVSLRLSFRQPTVGRRPSAISTRVPCRGGAAYVAGRTPTQRAGRGQPPLDGGLWLSRPRPMPWRCGVCGWARYLTQRAGRGQFPSDGGLRLSRPRPMPWRCGAYGWARYPTQRAGRGQPPSDGGLRPQLFRGAFMDIRKCGCL